MKYNELDKEDYEFIKQTYESSNSKEEAQDLLSDKYDVSTRTIRDWAQRIGLVGMQVNEVNDPSRILIYDIETSQLLAKVFWSGKQFVGHEQIYSETKVITISWQWLDSNNIYSLTWDKNHNDFEMLKEFAEVYNRADLVVGINNNNFDNRIIQARFAKHNIMFNPYVRSFDIQKAAKSKFRLISYSLKYMTKYFGVDQKLNHEGIKMWNMVEDGSPEEQAEYLAKMVEYNKGDIIATTALYYRLRPYFGHCINLGIGEGEHKWVCPDTGSTNVELYKTTWTALGTIQRIMVSNETQRKYKISNKQYLAYINHINKAA